MPNVEILMKNLGISEEEAKRVIEEDSKIDRMNKVADIQNDLTSDQIAAAKKARSAARKINTFNFNKKEKKVDEDKKTLISNLLEFYGNDIVEVINDEREFTFKYNSKLYKITLSAPRS